MDSNFGQELILDLHDCDNLTFTRKSIRKYLVELCKVIDMKRENLYWWDYFNHPEEYKKAPKHLKGTSVVQFIKTSNITIHTLDELNCVYINIFSCKSFDTQKAKDFTANWFKGNIVNCKIVDRI